MQVWLEARAASSFELLRPALERTLELRRRYVECFEPRDEPYDVLLDDYEPETETEQVREIFDAVKPELVALTAEHRGRDGDDGFLRGTFPAERQEAVARELVELFGMRPGAWRIDPTAHPFEAAVASDDIRLTTRYPPDSLEAVFSTMHEYGHGLYDHQIPRSLCGLPTGTAASFGLHESQSRLWENLVGRSLPFWRLFYPRLRERFPEQLGGVELGRFYAAVNRVQPSLVRVDADEVTYGLHVILRFELEQELLAGRLELRDLPAAWNEGMWDYLGVEVPDDASGVLQDMHWASGMIGYFPTYLLGTIMSVQIWEKATGDLGDLDGQIERGEFAPLREWLGENVHAHGRKFAPQETLRRATGSTIDPQPYLAYLRRKFGVPLTSPAA
jgi:carboxypeptidase Taq